MIAATIATQRGRISGVAIARAQTTITPIIFNAVFNTLRAGYMPVRCPRRF